MNWKMIVTAILMLLASSCTPQIIHVDEQGNPVGKVTELKREGVEDRITFVNAPGDWFCAVYEEPFEQDQFFCFESELGN